MRNSNPNSSSLGLVFISRALGFLEETDGLEGHANKANSEYITCRECMWW